MKHIKLLALLFISTFIITSCTSDDDPEPINEEEVITTMIIELTSEDGTKVTLKSKDFDGEGPEEPIITGGILKANQKYNAVITLLNELENPAENITEEVAEEADEHQFFYGSTGDSVFSYSGENDSNGNPLGIKFTITTGDVGTEDYVILLRHEPNKNAEGVKSGKIENAGGETDIEVTFPIEFVE